MKNLFSIIVANYNNNEYLPELIASVQKQTYPNWELIIVDDCSDISPRKILLPYLNDNRINVIYHDENKGVGGAFRTGAQNTQGTVIGMLGADDALMPQALERMMKAHELNPEMSLINSDCYWCDVNLNVIEKYKFNYPLNDGEHLLDKLSVGNFATFKKILYQRTSGFDANLRKAVDHDIFLKLDEVGKLGYVHEPLYLYRSNPIGISQNENGIKAAQYSIIAKLNAYERRKVKTDVYNISKKDADQLKKTWYTRELYFLRKDGKEDELRQLFKKATTEYPGLLFKRSYIAHLVREFLK